MSAIHPRLITKVAGADARGDQPLQPRIEAGAKVFDLTASVVRWHILLDVAVDAYAYNEQVPGPRLEVTEGDRVRIYFRNLLPGSSTVHWHGLILPNEMDGPAKITQPPVPTGGTYTYEFDVGQHGSYFYHIHDHADRQQAFRPLRRTDYSPEEPGAGSRRRRHRICHPATGVLKREWLTWSAMLMEGGLPNYFTINGKAWPATEKIQMRVGQTVKLRFIGTNNNFVHPMHVHGGPFQVVAVDGETLPPTAAIPG